MTIDAYSPIPHYDVSQSFQVEIVDRHVLSLVNTGQANPASQGTLIAVEKIEVLPKARQSNLGVVIGIIVALEAVGLLLSFLLGRSLFSGVVNRLDTKNSLIFALVIYSVVAVWGFFLDSVLEFWLLAWMVAIVQGGSQALSRSLYAVMSPAIKSGEFFGLFGIMEKFSSIIGPALFAAAGVLFGSSRPAILSLILLFILGGYLLTRVDIEEGKRVAQAEDAELVQ